MHVKIIIFSWGGFVQASRESANIKKNPRQWFTNFGVHQNQVMLMLLWGPHFENFPGDISSCSSAKKAMTAYQDNKVMKTPFGTYPAKALDTDVAGILATRSPIYHSVSELIVGCAPYNPAEQLAPIFHQN